MSALMEEENVCSCLLSGWELAWESALNALATATPQRSKPLDRFKKDDDLNKGLGARSFGSLASPPLLSGVSNRKQQGFPTTFAANGAPLGWMNGQNMSPVTAPHSPDRSLQHSVSLPNRATSAVEHVPLHPVGQGRGGVSYQVAKDGWQRQSFQNIAELAYGFPGASQPPDVLDAPYIQPIGHTPDWSARGVQPPALFSRHPDSDAALRQSQSPSFPASPPVDRQHGSGAPPQLAPFQSRPPLPADAQARRAATQTLPQQAQRDGVGGGAARPSAWDGQRPAAAAASHSAAHLGSLGSVTGGLSGASALTRADDGGARTPQAPVVAWGGPSAPEACVPSGAAGDFAPVPRDVLQGGAQPHMALDFQQAGSRKQRSPDSEFGGSFSAWMTHSTESSLPCLPDHRDENVCAGNSPPREARPASQGFSNGSWTRNSGAESASRAALPGHGGAAAAAAGAPGVPPGASGGAAPTPGQQFKMALVPLQLQNVSPQGGAPDAHRRSSSGGESGGDGAATPRSIREIPFSELQLQQVIGEGGFGKVFRASWNGATVAVKVMSGDVSQRGDVISEFRRECETMSCLVAHQHVLQLLGACTRGPRLALVTEFCPRGSLYHILHSPNVHLSWRQILYMCLGVAKGMRHLHEHKVLHRDLKSGNLLVDENLYVKVADFGLSKVMADFQTMTGGLGTYQWMAPEVLANSRYSDKADVYSFGIVLWECAARQVPYAGMNGMQAAVAVMNRGLRPEIPSYTPEPLGILMRKCWAAVPQARPSFKEITVELTTMYKQMRAE